MVIQAALPAQLIPVEKGLVSKKLNRLTKVLHQVLRIHVLIQAAAMIAHETTTVQETAAGGSNEII
jgi:hypothetical protein